MKSTVGDLNTTLILPLLQGFFFKETDFYFHQFLSNFFKYSSSNFPSFYLYNIFAIYFSTNSPLLKSSSSTISNFSCHLTSALSLLSNSATASFAFSKFSSFSHISLSAVNFFHHLDISLLLFFFYLEFFLPPNLQLHPPLLVSLLLLSVPLFALYILLFD